MRNLSEHEIEAVGGEGFWGAVEGTLVGGATGVGVLGAAALIGVAVTGPVGVGVILGAAAIGAVARGLTTEY